MYRQTFRGWASYWQTLGHVLVRPHLAMALDTPLPQAYQQSRAHSGWSGVLVTCAVLLHHHAQLARWAASWTIPPSNQSMVLYGLALALIGLSSPTMYGLVRLYTLVTHVLVTTVFKVRGQRLRLLNLESTVLPLLALVACGIALLIPLPWVGSALIVASLSYGLILLARGYNVIFHQSKWGGFGLVVGGLFLTAFVFCVGAIAIAIGFGVISFFAAVIARPFHHG